MLSGLDPRQPQDGGEVAGREDLVKSANALFSVVKKGAVKIRIDQTDPLSEAVRAHQDHEGRKTTGSTGLLP